MGIEFELKFRATLEALEALRASVEGEENSYAMETTYYDTPDGALSTRHRTLRRRQENERSVCTLKIPAAAGAREEFEVDSPDIFSALPELCKLSGLTELSTFTKETLLPICGARFTRIAKTVCLSGCTVEVALDQGVLLGGGQQLPLCEIEFELKGGDRNIAIAYALSLAARFDLKEEPCSKFRRALALAKGENHG